MMIGAQSFSRLEILVVVAEAKSFDEAARTLGISQGAVSAKLKRLEAECPLPVFTLRGKKKVLTLYGRELYAAAKSEAESYRKRIESVNRKYLAPERLVLRIAGRTDVFDALASRFAFPGRIELSPCSSHDAVLALQNHDADFALSYERPDSTEAQSVKVLVSRAKLAVHSKRLGRRVLDLATAMDPEFLTRTPSILYQADGHFLRDWLDHLGVDPAGLRASVVVPDWRTIRRLVEEGRGYAMLPSYIETGAGVRSVELPPSVLPPFTFYVSYHRDLGKIAGFADLIARLRKEAPR